MKLETIRKSKKKSILIGGLIILSLVSVVTCTTTRAKYRSVQSLKLATGKVIYFEYDFKVIAMYQSEDGTNYSDIETMPGSNYVINESRSYCTTDGVTQNKGKLKTINGIHAISNLNKSEKCYIWFDKKLKQSDITLAKLNVANVKEGTPTFTSAAKGDGVTTDVNNSGIYRTADPMYATEDNPNPVTYYWRGAVTNNYVTFARKCWRIVRINGDGSIRLIYDGKTCHANGVNADSIIATNQTYSKSGVVDNSAYVGYTFVKSSQRTQLLTEEATSNLKKQIDDWFSNNFALAQREQVAVGKFCNDRRTKNDEDWRATGNTQYYAADARIYGGDKVPSLDCLNDAKKGSDIYNLKVGAITADEVQFAGASGTTTNTSYYLYNGQYYWTMSPDKWNGNNSNACVFYVDTSGRLNGLDSVSWDGPGVRPVINLKADTIFKDGGNGTQGNPYVVQE